MTELLICGELDDKTVRTTREGLLEVREAPEIKIVVCSPGGECHVYGAIVDMMELLMSQDMTIATMALGQCCSGAPLIVAAGTEGRRRSFKSTIWGLHLPFLTDVPEDSGEQSVEIRALTSTQDRYLNFLSRFTGRTRRYWNNRLRDKSMLYFSARDAQKMGLVDEVIRW